MWGLWRERVGGGEGEASRRSPHCCLPSPSPPQAQTRAALLRALQEDEEHWGSSEGTPSSLAQDVCEVGVGSGKRKETQRRMPGGKVGVAPPHPASPPDSCWRSTPSGRPASARSSGSGWPTAASGDWRSSCRGMGAGRGA